jgi:hypothetical protein
MGSGISVGGYIFMSSMDAKTLVTKYIKNIEHIAKSIFSRI